MKQALFALVAATALATYTACTPVEGSAKVGAPAPAFSLVDTNGKNYSLDGLKGKYVVLEWLNHDCPYVKKHYDSGNMQKLQKEMGARGVVWLSVNSSAEGKQGHFKQPKANQLTKSKGATPEAVLLDWDGKVGRAYGARTTPHMYIIDPAGKLIYQGAIDDTPSTSKADVKSAKNYVAQAMGEALAGQPVSQPSTKAYGCSVKY